MGRGVESGREGKEFTALNLDVSQNNKTQDNTLYQKCSPVLLFFQGRIRKLNCDH